MTIVFGVLTLGIATRPTSLIDSKCCARLADFGLAVVIDESTTEGVADSRGMRGTVRWMAPELLLPERFGFTGKFLNQLPSISTDIYAIGMIILEVSPRLHLPKCSIHLPVGSDGVPPIQRLPQPLYCHVQSHRGASAR